VRCAPCRDAVDFSPLVAVSHPGPPRFLKPVLFIGFLLLAIHDLFKIASPFLCVMGGVNSMPVMLHFGVVKF
jgi:hypothetical protein